MFLYTCKRDSCERKGSVEARNSFRLPGTWKDQDGKLRNTLFGLSRRATGQEVYKRVSRIQREIQKRGGFICGTNKVVKASHDRVKIIMKSTFNVFVRDHSKWTLQSILVFSLICRGWTLPSTTLSLVLSRRRMTSGR